MSGLEEDADYQIEGEVGPGGPPLPVKTDNEVLRAMIRRVKAEKKEVEALLDVEGVERTAESWQDRLSPVQYGRRIFLEPGQPARPRDIIRMNSLAVAEGEFLTAINKLAIQDIFAANKTSFKALPKGSDQEIELPRLPRSYKLLAMRAMQKSTRQATDRRLYWSNMVPFGEASRGHRRWLSYEYECLLREVRVDHPSPNEAELLLLAAICGLPGHTVLMRHFFDSLDELVQDLNACISGMSEEHLRVDKELSEKFPDEIEIDIELLR